MASGGGNRGEPDREHDIAKRVSIPRGLREMSARRSSIVKLSLVRSVGFYRAIMSGIIRHGKRFAMKDKISVKMYSSTKNVVCF